MQKYRSLPLNQKKKSSYNISKKIKTLPIKEKSYSILSSSSNVERSNDFIFFGCWNNINCSEELIHRNIILELLRLSNSGKPIVLAGDNWYNQKTDKKKTKDKVDKKDTKDKKDKADKKDVKKHYSTYVLKTGYELLFKASTDVTIVLGNHDITEDPLDIPTNSPQIKTLQKLDLFCKKLGCKVKVQAFIIENILKNYTLGLDFFTNRYINSKISNDTNIDVSINNNVSLYTCIPRIVMKTNGIYFLYLNTNVFESDLNTINIYIKSVQKELKKIKGNTINLLFIVGHHPFAGLKDKKDLSVKNVSDLYFKSNSSPKKDERIEAIYRFLDIFVEYKSIYLCADIHNFQICKLYSNKLNSEMCMVICGSGGANQDLIGKYDNSKFDIEVDLIDSENEYIVKDLYVHNAYGFCNLSYSAKGNKVEVQYYKYKRLLNNTIEYNIFTYTLHYKTSTKKWNITKQDPSMVKSAETKEQFISSEHCDKLILPEYLNNC